MVYPKSAYKRHALLMLAGFIEEMEASQIGTDEPEMFPPDNDAERAMGINFYNDALRELHAEFMRRGSTADAAAEGANVVWSARVAVWSAAEAADMARVAEAAWAVTRSTRAAWAVRAAVWSATEAASDG